ncbi:hypothetical protein EJ419_02480 [Alloscardovia theropitheci]|uniref:Uncharacterized protein n=2 Tax=Alloscardovia theropitheci TaxID=2496842 RepID=A0A4R0QY04_9BIFI|nr:hypothetical protein [Alloscardovia theropitheci]TCD54590.1 hypothetical protein EJ419_02480 [Alloscardovia theropitheci]
MSMNITRMDNGADKGISSEEIAHQRRLLHDTYVPGLAKIYARALSEFRRKARSHAQSAKENVNNDMGMMDSSIRGKSSSAIRETVSQQVQRLDLIGQE